MRPALSDGGWVRADIRWVGGWVRADIRWVGGWVRADIGWVGGWVIYTSRSVYRRYLQFLPYFKTAVTGHPCTRLPPQ